MIRTITNEVMDRGKHKEKKDRRKKKNGEENWDEDEYELSKKKLRIEKIEKERSGGMGRDGKNNKRSIKWNKEGFKKREEKEGGMME